MARLIVLTLVNLSLPFLFWALKIYAIRVWNKRHKKPLPDYHFPSIKLLFAGVALLVVALIVTRFITVEIDTEWNVSNPSISQEY